MGMGLHRGACAKGNQVPDAGDGPSPNTQGASTWRWLAACAAWQPSPCQSMLWGETVVSDLNSYLFSFTGPSLVTMSREPGFFGQVAYTLLVSIPCPVPAESDVLAEALQENVRHVR